MSLPTNYKQIAVGAPTGPPTSTPSGASGSSRSRSSGAGGGSDRNKDTTPIFTHSNYGNPAFTPQKAGKSSSSKSQAESRTPKPPKPPEKPVLPYMRYSKRIWDSVKAQYPDLKLWELGKKIGAMWKQLTESEKQEFVDEYEADKAEYEKALKAYHSSPAYLSYLLAKSKVKSDADIHETPSRSSGKSQQERRIDIQPAEDEDDQDEGYSFKHLAYARYLRNHRLINEIFSDAVVPDVRTVVTTQRMQVLKRQVSSLTMHQTKLEAELQQMEEKFEAKKQRMMESSEAFQEELKRHCKPAVDEDTFQKMVQRMYEDMKRERQRVDDHPQSATSATAPPPSVRSEEKASAVVQPPAMTAQGAPTAAAKKDLPPPTPVVVSTIPTNLVQSHESGSKTEPEPMDIEPPQKPSVPLPAKPEAPKVAGKPFADPVKEPATKPPTPTMVKPMPLNKAPTPTPTPTPPPQAILNEQPTTMNQPPNVAPTINPPPPPQMNVQSTAAPPPPQPQQQQQAQPPQPQPQPQQPQPPPQQQVPQTMPLHPHHPPPPPHSHLPPHMPPHQPMSAMPPHTGYGSYGAPTGPTRSPYYQSQYGAHPAQPYGQYAPYPHYQQPYGPPPGSHYMNARPPPQHNGTPVHYPDHATGPVPGQQQPLDVYGQPPAHNPVLPQQQPVPTATAAPPPMPPTVGGSVGGTAPTADATKSDGDKKENVE